MEKRGDISVTTIIVAAISLIVLVVLVMVFTGRIGIFKAGVEKAGETELKVLQVSYNDCHPSTVAEAAFLTDIGRAVSETEKEDARNILKGEIERCRSFVGKDSCEGAGCSWK